MGFEAMLKRPSRRSSVPIVKPNEGCFTLDDIDSRIES